MLALWGAAIEDLRRSPYVCSRCGGSRIRRVLEDLDNLTLEDGDIDTPVQDCARVVVH